MHKGKFASVFPHTHKSIFFTFPEGTEVLFGEPAVSCQCFSSVIDKKTAHPRPKTIEFTDNPQLDHALTNIIMVLLMSPFCVSLGIILTL